MEDGLEAFASDVRSVCALFTAAAHRPKTPLAARLAERRAPEVAAAVTRLLDANFALRLGEARAGRRHSQAAAGEAAGAAEANGDAGADGKSPDVDLLSRSARRSLLALCVSASARLAGGAPANVQAQLSHARHCANCPVRITCWARALQCAGHVYDVTVWSWPWLKRVCGAGRPFVWPWQGCAACWEEEDTRALLLCDRCDAETHTYCLNPPLRDIPPGALPPCALHLANRSAPRAPCVSAARLASCSVMFQTVLISRRSPHPACAPPGCAQRDSCPLLDSSFRIGLTCSRVLQVSGTARHASLRCRCWRRSWRPWTPAPARLRAMTSTALRSCWVRGCTWLRWRAAPHPWSLHLLWTGLSCVVCGWRAAGFGCLSSA